MPYSEAIGLYKQVRALARGEEVSYMDMTFNALAVISVVPIAKPLAPLVRGLRSFLDPIRRSNPKFTKAVGGVMAKLGDDVLNRRFNNVVMLLPFILVIGEMVADAEARQGAMLMLNSIASADDIMAWAEYFGLPADGWDGDEVPEVDLAMMHYSEPAYFAYPLMGEAYAARRMTARRVKGEAKGKEIVELIRRNPDIVQNPSVLSKGVRGITAGAKQTTYKSIRAMVHSGFMLQASTRVLQSGRANVQALIVGRPDQRVRPEIILASILYLESNKDSLFATDNELNRRDSLTSLYELYARLMLNTNEPWAERKYHGAAFHLMMLTYYDLLHQVAGQPPVKAIEAVRKLEFGDSRVKYNREVDIVLDLGENKERFVELKSMRRPASGPDPLTASFFQTWQFGSGKVARGQHLHKEFFTDWVQANTLPTDEKPLDVSMAWRFHTFVSKDKRVRGPVAANMSWVKDRLCKMPSGIGGNVTSWLEKETKKTTVQLERDCKSRADVQVQHARTVVNDFIRNGLFGDVGDVLEDLLKDLMGE